MLNQKSTRPWSLLLTTLLLVLLTQSCSKPLSDKEEKYFNHLSKECDCTVTREYDEDATKDFKGGPGWYKLILTYDQEPDPDSLQVMSSKVAFELHEKVLTDVDYPYNEIEIICFLNNGNEELPLYSCTYHSHNHDRFYPF